MDAENTTQETLQNVYASTGSVTRAAQEAGVSRTLAYYHLTRAGYDFSRNAPLAELLKLRDTENLSYAQLARHFGVTKGTIHNWMVKAGRVGESK